MDKSFVRVLLITLFLQTAVYGLRPMVSYKAISVGANTFDLGMIASSFAVLSLLVAVSIGRWVDRWGEARFVTAGAVVICAVCVSLLWIDTVWILALSQALLGLGHILSVVATQTLVANLGKPGQRQARFGVFTVAVSLGQLIGPAGAGLLAGNATTSVSGQGSGQVGTGPVFASAAAITLVATLLSISLGRRGKEAPARTEASTVGTEPGAQPSLSYWSSIGRVFRIPSMPQAMLVSLTVLTAIDILSAYLPAYGEANGLSVETVGFLLAARAAASMASRLVMLPLLRVLKLPHLLAMSTILPALSLGIFPFLESHALIYLVMVLAGFGLGLGQPVTLSWVAGQAPREIRGTALGVRLTGNRLGQTALPSAVGVIASASSITAVFIALAGLLGISTIAVLTANFSGEPPAD
jgi:MFS family permease